MLPLSLPLNDQLYSNITSLEFARECININLRILILNATSRHNVNMKCVSVSRFFCQRYYIIVINDITDAIIESCSYTKWLHQET